MGVEQCCCLECWGGGGEAVGEEGGGVSEGGEGDG